MTCQQHFANSNENLTWTASSLVGARTKTIGPSPGFRYCYHGENMNINRHRERVAKTSKESKDAICLAHIMDISSFHHSVYSHIIDASPRSTYTSPTQPLLTHMQNDFACKQRHGRILNLHVQRLRVTIQHVERSARLIWEIGLLKWCCTTAFANQTQSSDADYRRNVPKHL